MRFPTFVLLPYLDPIKPPRFFLNETFSSKWISREGFKSWADRPLSGPNLDRFGACSSFEIGFGASGYTEDGLS